ncbi:hypothetical protein [Streptomyces sp. NBC_00057]|uniref:hypothetical protein n=1 Tax=Streptomyces sp. NBC_00057 TaxID=2975634 RepID=UPI003250E837
MGEGTRQQHFRIGDILRVSCPSVRVRVVQATRFDVAIEWPWAQIDPESEIQWNGLRGIPRTEGAYEWNGLFRTDPEPGRLEIGDSCLVGIPESLVRIIDIGRYDPPADVGWLPRPHTMLVVLPAGRPHEPHAEEEGDTIDLDSAAPIRIDLISRS